MMADVVLRVRYKSDCHVLGNLKGSSTCEDLKEAISLATSLRKNCFRVLSRFPPKPQDLSNAELTLHNLGIKSGDLLIVETLSVAENLQRNFRNPENCCPSSCNPSGVFMKKAMPADNSCLFTSVYFIISEGIFDVTCAKAMRKIIADVVGSDREMYSEAVLGKSNGDYRRWILDDASWGGAIELAILSSYFGLELAVIDAQTGRIDRFGEDHRYPCRGYLLYTGIHYDPLMLEETTMSLMNDEPGLPRHSVRTVFASNDERAFQMALEIGAEAKSSHQYTDLHRCALQCLICNAELTGQQEAAKHVKETGHTKFDEIS